MSGKGKIVSQGRFRVDRKKALEKMERFQLEDPHRYVLEWVAAAVSGGADRIDIYNDADDFRISWSGTRLSGEELDTIFDHLWGSAEDPHTAVLQHLGLGVLGALGLQPKWVHVDSGSDEHDLRLAVDDPLQTQHVALGTREVQGLRCHVREQLTGTTVREALTAMFQRPAETRLIQGAARWCPVPVWINGKPIPTPLPPDDVLVAWTGKSGRLWLTVEKGPAVDLLRHGLVVGHHTLEVGHFHLGGWWRDDTLKLNASRSQVVNDDQLLGAIAGLERELARALREDLPAALREGADRDIAWRGEGDRSKLKYRSSLQELLTNLACDAIVWLGTRKEKLGPLGELSLLEDVSGRAWSLAELLQLTKPVGTAERAFDDPDFDHVLFVGPHAAILRSAWPEVADLTAKLQERAEGRVRRARAAQTPRRPEFDSSNLQHTFRDGPLAGAVRRDLGQSKHGMIRVQVRIGQLPLCVTEASSPIDHLEAILDHPGFLADAAFRDVVRDDTWKRALAVLQEAILDYTLKLMARAPHEGLIMLTELITRTARKQQLLGEIDLDPRFRELALIPTGRERISVRQILARTEGDPWWVVSMLPGSCPPEIASIALVLPENLHAPWLRWLGDRGRNGVKDLPARIERARRMAQPRLPAEITGEHVLKLKMRGANLRGEIGLRWALAPGVPPQNASVTVLRDGVMVTVMRLALSLPGVIAVVDSPAFEVNEAHDALIDPKALIRQLEPFVDELALDYLAGLETEEAHQLPEQLLGWLAERHAHVELGDKPVVYTVGGKGLSLRDLAESKKGKRGAKLRVIKTAPDGLPGFDDAVVHTPQLAALLHAVASGKWRDATDEVNQAAGDFRAFMAKDTWAEPRSLVRRPLEESGWRGVALLPLGEELGASRVTVLWHGRVLLTRFTPQANGVSLVVWGADLRPNRSFNDLEDSRALGKLESRASELLLPMLGQAFEEISVPERLSEAWLQLARRLHSRMGHPAVDKLFALPLVRRVGEGPLSLVELAKVLRKSTVLRVSNAVPDGPVDDAIYLRELHGLEALVSQAFGQALPPGEARLLEWRKGEERKSRLTRLTPHVRTDLPVLRRENLGDRGEVALLGAGKGLQVQALVDGLPLQIVQLDCPVPALAVIQGEGVRADREFLKPEESGPWRKRVDEVREVVHRLVERRLEAHRPGKDAPSWAWHWLLSEPRRRQLELDAPVFPLADGSFASLRELSLREKRDGGVGIVTAMGPAPRPPQPVYADPTLRELLSKRFTVVDLTLRRQPAALSLPLPGEKPRKGSLAVGKDGIRLIVGEWLIDPRISCPGPLALQGHVIDESITPHPLWKLPQDDAASRALMSWLEETSRSMLVELASKGSHPQALLDALMTLTEGKVEGLASTKDAVLVSLRAAPLFVDSQGQRLSLDQLLQHESIRAVPPDARGEALPGKPPFVCLDPKQQAWLRGLRKVRDGQEEMKIESKGAKRRRNPLWRKHIPPLSASSWRQGEVQATLWFGRSEPPRLLRDGREICALEECPPGITGWIEGPFEVNDAFDEAELPAGIKAKVQESLASLLKSAEPNRVFAALIEARGAKSLQNLLQRQPCWREVALFDDVATQPVTLETLLAQVKKGKLLYARSGTAVPEDDLVLAAGPTEIEWLRQLFPGFPVQLYMPAGQAKAAKKERREKREAERNYRAELLELARSLGGGQAVWNTIEAEVDRWLESGQTAPKDGHERLLVAWQLISKLQHELGTPKAELDTLLQVAKRL